MGKMAQSNKSRFKTSSTHYVFMEGSKTCQQFKGIAKEINSLEHKTLLVKRRKRVVKLIKPFYSKIQLTHNVL